MGSRGRSTRGTRAASIARPDRAAGSRARCGLRRDSPRSDARASTRRCRRSRRRDRSPRAPRARPTSHPRRASRRSSRGGSRGSRPSAPRAHRHRARRRGSSAGFERGGPRGPWWCSSARGGASAADVPADPRPRSDPLDPRISPFRGRSRAWVRMTPSRLWGAPRPTAEHRDPCELHAATCAA